jgi:hypothetical protein
MKRRIAYERPLANDNPMAEPACDACGIISLKQRNTSATVALIPDPDFGCAVGN